MPNDGEIQRIRRLSSHLANRIAAGEVVERPASVVKELVENSLDAGAHHIQVYVEQGGRRLIRVHDDGCGIHPEDLLLALDRHATSKLVEDDDLVNIDSLGFRGEALPSIGSVSRLNLTSRSLDSEQGWTLACHGSEIRGEPTIIAHNPGSTVEVVDLFYNTPARRKFLRTDKTEFAHIRDRIVTLALSRFDVSFDLYHNQRQVLHLKAAKNDADRERRVIAICGKAFMSQALYLDFEASGLRLSGWAARPDTTRSSSTLQYFYVNGRPVRDRLVNHAVRQVYNELGFTGSHPGYVLYLQLSPQLVDMNVHPAKHEVRFRDNRLVHDFLTHSLRRALQGDVTTGTAIPMDAMPEGGIREQAGIYSRAKESLTTNDGDYVQAQVLAVLYDRYLLYEYESEIRLMDLYKAQEKLLYQKIHTELKNGKLTSQPVLIPEVIRLNQQQAEWFEQYSSQLQELGFDIDRQQQEAVVVRQVPECLGMVPATALIGSILDVLENSRYQEPETEIILQSLLTTAAASIPDNEAELDELVQNVMLLNDSSLWTILSAEKLRQLFSS